MSEPDIEVVARLQLQRESWIAELQNSKVDLEKTAAEMSRMPIRIPVEIDDRATAAIARIRAEAASAPIRIPVELDYGGVGGGGGMPAMAAASMQMVGPSAMRGQYMEYLARNAAPPMVGMGRAQLQGGIDEVSAAMDARNRMFAGAESGGMAEAGAMGAAGAGGGSLMGGLRLMAGVHIAMKGIEAASSSYNYAFGERDPEIDSGSVAADKEELRRLKAMRGGFYGLTGMGRDLVHWAGRQFAPMSSGDDGFDDELRQNSIEKSIKDTQAMERELPLENRLRTMEQSGTDRLSAARGAFNVASMPEGLQRKMAEIHKATEALADGFQKEADALDLAAEKSTNAQIKQKAHAQAAALRAQGGQLAADIDAAEAREATHEDYVTRTNRSDLMGARLGTGRADITALDQAFAGNTLGSTVTRINARRESEKTTTHAAYMAAHGKITETEQGEIWDQIDAGANADIRAAKRADAMKWGRMTDEIHELQFASPYRQQIERIRHESNRAADADPAHASEIGDYASAQLSALDRRHSLSATRMFQSAQAMTTAVGSPAMTIKDKQGRDVILRQAIAANPAMAAAQELYHQGQADLSQEEGDGEMQKATRAHVAAEAHRMLMQRGIDQKTRSFLENLEHGKWGAPNKVTPMSSSGGNSGDAAAFKDAVSKLDKAAGKIANAKDLYSAGL